MKLFLVIYHNQSLILVGNKCEMDKLNAMNYFTLFIKMCENILKINKVWHMLIIYLSNTTIIRI